MENNNLITMTTSLRYRGNKNNLIELAKNLDAFKKVPEEYTETTEVGGTLSLMSRLLIVYLIYKEFLYYREANLIYQFQPDIDMDDRVQMNVDITVAMPCSAFSGVELKDETQQEMFTYDTMVAEDTWWQLPQEQREQFERAAHMNSYLREEYHSVAEILFKDIIKSDEIFDEPITHNKHVREEKYDACRLHGSFYLNKVNGVLQMTGGAQPSVNLFNDHWLIEFHRRPTNFTHRINRFSFGQYSKRIVQPLEGDERIIGEDDTIVQYFLKIVPTEIHNIFSTINTYQYSVTENIRKLDSERNSYGSPGIYFKYDWSALKVVVRSNRDNLIQFTIRLCSIISGIIVISGILNAVIVYFQRRFIQALAPQYAMKPMGCENFAISSVTTPTVTTSPIVPPIRTNDLISAANDLPNVSVSPMLSNAGLIPPAAAQ